jgi:DNA-binding MarR family transcriptional regulator
VSELADVLGLERTTLTRGAGVLEQKGWLTETPTSDARERRLELTAQGRRKLEEAFPAWKEAQNLFDRELAARKDDRWTIPSG